MKILDITTMRPKGRNARTNPGMRTIEVHNEPEGGKYCLHVHHRSQYTLMVAAQDDQIIFYQFGPGATFFNDEDLVDLLLANNDFCRQVDEGEYDLTDGIGYKILSHNTGQFVIDTGLQRGKENQCIPVAQMGNIRNLQFGSKYLRGENISGLSKRSNVRTRYSDERHIRPDIDNNEWLQVPKPNTERYQQMLANIGR